MFLSIFEIFKIGIGPSSSHTVGPMVASARFLRALAKAGHYPKVHRIEVRLYGSLAFTGKGHASDIAVLLGLAGEFPDQIDPDQVATIVQKVTNDQSITLKPKFTLNMTPELEKLNQLTKVIGFDPKQDIIFDYGIPLPHHANGLKYAGFDQAGNFLFEEIYYSVGGGFVQSEAEMSEMMNFSPAHPLLSDVPYAFSTADEMLRMGKESGLTIAQMKRANECTRLKDDQLNLGIDRLIAAMESSIERGLRQHGILPGGLKVKRRAPLVLKEIENRKLANLTYPHDIMDHISLYALAVNEENAAGGRIVTAPTNGAAGIIPSVLAYYRRFCPKNMEWDPSISYDFLLTAAAIGGIIKHNASISGAEVGCQGEVGSASAMAAAGLAAALGGTNEQIENAAEIALEHHLGMTCDPIGGLVQIPCIERNAMGAVKAVNAASLSLKGDGTHFVSLDAAIRTMKETGNDMLSKYKETSQGGLAVNVVAC